MSVVSICCTERNNFKLCATQGLKPLQQLRCGDDQPFSFFLFVLIRLLAKSAAALSSASRKLTRRLGGAKILSVKLLLLSFVSSLIKKAHPAVAGTPVFFSTPPTISNSINLTDNQSTDTSR
tara:strand:- start:132 stop:497 length:366 start_codon:yes stop_codon:yes gene_type:complete